MRKLVVTAAVVCARVAAADPGASVSSSVTAQTMVEQPGPTNMEAGIFVGGFISNSAHNFYDYTKYPNGMRPNLNTVAPQFGARYAYFLHRYIGIEGEGSVTLEGTQDTSDSVTIYRLGAQALFQLPGRITPFVAAGFGVWHSSSDMLGDSTHEPIHAGIGVRFYATSTLALRADLRYYRGPSDHDPYTLDAGYGEFSVGMSWVPHAKLATAHVEHHVEPVDPDPDHDGVIGAADKCPNEFGATADGCPMRDTDGDGILDAHDKCPTEPETFNGYQDQDGCPDKIPDTDGDGINDLADKCVAEPEDKDGFQDADGCPDPDNDNDGVPDVKDRCPNQAGPAENDGCPDTDKDSDGVVDRIDNCPEDKGTAANHGCRTKQLVAINKTQVVLLEGVKFQAGTAKLTTASKKVLDNAARVLLAHLEIWKVRVEGYTDNAGKPEVDQKLSKERASAVVAYLVKTGKIAPERLESVGHGQDNPIGDNKTAKGREQNKRIELTIIPQDPVGAAPKS